MIDYYMEVTNELSVTLAIVTFFGLLIFGYFAKKEITLEQALTNALASAMMPTGFALIFCSFDIEKINQIEGLSLQISVAGLALLYISAKSIIDTIKKENPGTKNPDTNQVQKLLEKNISTSIK